MIGDARVLTANVIFVARSTGHNFIFFHEAFSCLAERVFANTFAPNLSVFQIEVPALGKLLCQSERFLMRGSAMVLTF